MLNFLLFIFLNKSLFFLFQITFFFRLVGWFSLVHDFHMLSLFFTGQKKKVIISHRFPSSVLNLAIKISEFKNCCY